MLHEKADRLIPNAEVLDKLPGDTIQIQEGRVARLWEIILDEWKNKSINPNGLKVFLESFTKEAKLFFGKGIASMGRNGFLDFLKEEHDEDSSFKILLGILIAGGANFEVTEDEGLVKRNQKTIILGSYLMTRFQDEAGIEITRRLLELDFYGTSDDKLQQYLDENERARNIYSAIEANGEDYANEVDLRDRFIARQINASLGNSEIGILILGARHEPFKYLKRDVKVELISEKVAEIDGMEGCNAFLTGTGKERK